MMYPNSYEAQVSMEMAVAERRREAESQSLSRQAQGDRPGWWRRQGSHLVYRLGQWLVVVGRQLQGQGSAPPVCLESGERAEL
jgi:hypothetical protein